MKDVEKITIPSGVFTNYVYKAIPLAFDESMSYYEMLCGILDIVKNEVDVVNNNADILIELKNYVDHYFDNLDVQEEINKKLDEMALNGTLTLLIKNYIDPIYQSYEQDINNTVNNLEEQMTTRLNQQDSEIYTQNSLIENQNNNIATIDNKVNSAVSGTPKGVYATVAALEAADPDHDYIYVVSADGKWYYYSNGWTAGGNYQSSGILDNSIDVEKLSSNLKYSINCDVLSPTWVTGYYINNQGNIIENASYEYCEINLKKGDKLVFSPRGTTSTTVLGSYQRYRDGKHYYNIITGTGAVQDINHTVQYDGIYVLCGRTEEMADTQIKVYSKNISENLDITNKLNFLNIIIKTGNSGLTANKTVSAISGAINDYTDYNNEFYVTSYLQIRPNTSISLESKTKQLTPTTQQFFGLAFYDENYTFISGIKYDVVNKITTTTPINAKYIALTITSAMYSAGYSLYYTNLSSILNNYKEVKDVNYFDLYKSFDIVGVIGDSLCVGEFSSKVNEEVVLHDDIEISWPRYMEKLSNNTYKIFGAGGMTTKSWLTNSHGYPSANLPANKCKAYIIGLGVNDANNLGSDYLGTSADINLLDYTQNADSYYGNYAGIIQRMQEIQPKAKFFLLTMPREDAIYQNYNTAIRNIATMLDNCYVIDLENDYISNFASGSFIDNNKRNGHYNAIAYNVIAQDLAKWISKVMYENYTEFKFIEYIGTDYEY